MKKMIAFGFVAVMAMGLVGCGKNACEQQADIYASAPKDYCGGKDAECYYCECVNKGEMVDVKVEGTEVKYGCKAIPTTTTTVTVSAVACEGAVLTAAEGCTKDTAACKTAAQAVHKTACDAMKKK